MNAEGGLALDVFVIGVNLDNSAFDLPDLERQLPLLRQADTILMDVASRPEIGSLDIGRRIEIGQRSVTIGGRYNLGRGFLGFVIAITSDLNFVRLFPNQGRAKLSSVRAITEKSSF